MVQAYIQQNLIFQISASLFVEKFYKAIVVTAWTIVRGMIRILEITPDVILRRRLFHLKDMRVQPDGYFNARSLL